MIDSITKLCLSLLVCKNGLSYWGKETQPTLCTKRRQTNLASEIINEINISCYTEYQAFGPSLIYNNVITFGLVKSDHSIDWYITFGSCLICYVSIVTKVNAKRRTNVVSSVWCEWLKWEVFNQKLDRSDGKTKALQRRCR